MQNSCKSIRVILWYFRIEKFSFIKFSFTNTRMISKQSSNHSYLIWGTLMGIAWFIIYNCWILSHISSEICPTDLILNSFRTKMLFANDHTMLVQTTNRLGSNYVVTNWLPCYYDRIIICQPICVFKQVDE